MNSKQEHIEHMRRNLEESKVRLSAGKITPAQYRALARDVKRRISEIRAEPKHLWRW